SVEGVMRTRVTVKCAGEEIGHLPFDVTVTAKFHAAALVIRDARIAGFGGGDYEITLKIALFEKELCEPISLYKSRLPVQVPFEPGLPSRSRAPQSPANRLIASASATSRGVTPPVSCVLSRKSTRFQTLVISG